jgi:drug/metabolite transporter (DMT)-like permease
VLVGIILALLTSIAWAFGNVFVQRSSRAVGEARSLLWSFVIGGLLSGAAVPLFDRPTAPVDAAAVAWLVGAGVSSLTAYGGMFFAFSRGDLTLTVPFVSSWSLVAGVIGLVAFGERPHPLQLVGAVVVFAGVMLVALGSGHAPGPNARVPSRWAKAAAILAGLGFGVMFPAMSQAAPAFGTFGAATLVYAISVLLGLPVALLARLDLRRPPRAAWPVLLGTGLFETAGFILLTAAGLVAPLSVVAPVASLAAAFTVLYAFLFLHERPGRRALVGAVLASVGVVVLSAARP